MFTVNTTRHPDSTDFICIYTGIKCFISEVNNLNGETVSEQFGDNAVTGVWHFNGPQWPEREQRATTEQ